MKSLPRNRAVRSFPALVGAVALSLTAAACGGGTQPADGGATTASGDSSASGSADAGGNNYARRKPGQLLGCE